MPGTAQLTVSSVLRYVCRKMAILAAASRRVMMPGARRFSTGATFPPSASERPLAALDLDTNTPICVANTARRCTVKTGRPDVGELSRGQNVVRETSVAYLDNVTPTWQKGKTDGVVNIVGNCMQIFGFLLIVRGAFSAHVHCSSAHHCCIK